MSGPVVRMLGIRWTQQRAHSGILQTSISMCAFTTAALYADNIMLAKGLTACPPALSVA